ncbi:hypothetical protein ACE6HX_05920 [Bacillus pumilus]|uniref:hypothetical protein n=1 Tax=Bacillus TaxID=1386 RepID=UPI0035D0BC23
MKHHYEQMHDWPSELLVMGAALCTSDPIHGQGMTKAALEAQILERMLKQAQKKKQLSFEKDTLQKMQHANELGWWLCAIADLAWNGVELKGETAIPHLTFVQGFLNRYVQYAIVTKQPERLEAYHRMHSFLTEPRDILNLEQLHDMIQSNASGETAEWWSQWDKEDDEGNRAFFHEAVPAAPAFIRLKQKKAPSWGFFINVIIEVRFAAVGLLVLASLETLEKECCSL